MWLGSDLIRIGDGKSGTKLDDKWGQPLVPDFRFREKIRIGDKMAEFLIPSSRFRDQNKESGAESGVAFSPVPGSDLFVILCKPSNIGQIFRILGGKLVHFTKGWEMWNLRRLPGGNAGAEEGLGYLRSIGWQISDQDRARSFDGTLWQNDRVRK